MQNWAKRMLCGLCTLSLLFVGAGCVEKHITVITREQGSGTREAFDRMVTDGNGKYLEMQNAQGKKVYNTTDRADIQKETGNVISKVSTDRYAIGYISIGSLNTTVKTVAINGVMPTAKNVITGGYPLSRPFVIMTSSVIPLTERTADFLLYLKSDEVSVHADEAGCIFVADPVKRATSGGTPVPVARFTPQPALPAGEKVVINGSTSIERFIKKSMAGYAKVYGKGADELFTLDLQGSSVGKTAVKNDKKGNVIGLSSATVNEAGVDSFNVCMDGVAVIVHRESPLQDVTLAQLYAIYAGEVITFAEIVGKYE